MQMQNLTELEAIAENQLLLNEKQNQSLEQELINELRVNFRKRNLSDSRYRRVIARTHLKISVKKLRDLRMNRERWPDKFAVALRAYYFYRNEGYRLQDELHTRVVTVKSKEVYEYNIGYNDVYVKDLRKLLTTSFLIPVEIPFDLMINIYRELDLEDMPPSLRRELENIKLLPVA